MAKKLHKAEPPKRAVPTQRVSKLKAGDVIFMPGDTAKLIKLIDCKARVQTKKKDLRIMTLELTTGPARGRQVEFLVALDDRMEIVKITFWNKASRWLKKFGRLINPFKTYR